MAVLLTGFQAFFPALETYILGNSSEKIVSCFAAGPPPATPSALRAELSALTASVDPRILPVKQGNSGVTGSSAGALAKLLSALQPSGVLCLGHFLPIIGEHLPFTGAHARLELLAYRPEGLSKGGIETQSWFAKQISRDARQQGIDPSNTAEWRARGPCNDTYWTALEWGGKSKPVAFLHVPPFVSRTGEEDVLRQALFVLRRVVNAAA